MQPPFQKNQKRLARLSFLLVVLISWAAYCCLSGTAQNFPGLKVACSSNDPSAIKILFIGNSFTYANDVPTIFAWMLKKQQPQSHFQIISFTLPGYALPQHAQRYEVQSLLSKQSWNIVILQDQSGAALKGQSSLNESFDALLPFIKKARAKPLAIMTWADRGRPADQSIISQTYRRTGRDLHMDVLPVGDLFFYVQEKWPNIELYGEDDHHPAIAGSYLYALTTYAHIFGDKNLPTLDNNDKTAPAIKADVARTLSILVREWPSICRTHPEFTEE